MMRGSFAAVSVNRAGGAITLVLLARMGHVLGCRQ
ncbi:conserved hypothetical protein [Roseovarius sp. EC-HK134]|jgi:hypothetical protein|nr:hypothetical protein RTM1035_16007 [Roseovarius sp. TM1035]VVT03878.1 conserved hypothetical protein [Roseovarius sp. EC-HK134]VVT04299.1 conserved hypothetical protein [Roseovarius sp. EC-SD190]